MEEYTLEDFKNIVNSTQLLAIIENRTARKKTEKELSNEKRRITAQNKRKGKTNDSGKKKQSKEECIEVIDTVKQCIEDSGMVYKASSEEYTYALNIKRGKAFNSTAQKYNLTYLELCTYIIKASIMDKFRCGKVTNCMDLYLNYAKIINAYQVNKTKAVNSIAVLPGA